MLSDHGISQCTTFSDTFNGMPVGFGFLHIRIIPFILVDQTSQCYSIINHGGTRITHKL